MPVKKRNKEAGSAYGAQQITILEGLEPVRKRPGMYIGSTGPEGLHHLVWEVLDNAIDEAMGGFCSEIEVVLLPESTVRISDNGRGIPVDKHPQAGVSALEVVLTKLHAGGKFGQGGYKVSGGLHGVGVSVVNALSIMMRAEVHREGKIWMQEYKQGNPVKRVQAVGTAKDTGTIITFKPDAGIFETIEFSREKILDHVRQQAYLTKGIRIVVKDLRDDQDEWVYGFYFDGGVASFIRHLNFHKQVKHDAVYYIEKEVVPDSVESDKTAMSRPPVKAEVALQYTDDFTESVFGFANNIFNPEGGTHIVGFRSALTRTLNGYARSKGFLKEKDENLTGEDVREGLTAIVSVKVAEPQFEGQTKAKLGNTEVRAVVESVVNESFSVFLEEHPRDAEHIIGKCVLAQRARVAAKAARDTVLRKGALEGLTLPGKLADCSSRDTASTELFIVEGDSAGGSGKQGRDREHQAILPLRGKILNVERARIDRLLANNEIKSLIIALGTNIGEAFELEKLRYGKIIIMTDADADGAHIRTLLLTLFYRYFPLLITEGHLYIAQPPLYRIQKGREFNYAYTEAEKGELIEKMNPKAAGQGKPAAQPALAEIESENSATSETGQPTAGDRGVGEIMGGFTIQRYKGLGEMNPEQLWETTMDPAQRVLKRVVIEDAERAAEIFDILMGSEVAPRKGFIQTHARSVSNLDV